MSRSSQTSQRGPSSGSQVESTPRRSTDHLLHTQGTLRLRAENNPAAGESDQNRSSSRRIQWREDVIDNEGMGKKSSKVCCIYHKNRPVGESSSESESSDSSSQDSESDCDKHQQDSRGISHGLDHGRSNTSQRPTKRGQSDCSKRNGKHKQRKRSPNAYEKMPRINKGR